MSPKPRDTKKTSAAKPKKASGKGAARKTRPPVKTAIDAVRRIGPSVFKRIGWSVGIQRMKLSAVDALRRVLYSDFENLIRICNSRRHTVSADGIEYKPRRITTSELSDIAASYYNTPFYASHLTPPPPKKRKSKKDEKAPVAAEPKPEKRTRSKRKAETPTEPQPAPVES